MVEVIFAEEVTQSDVYCSNIPVELADILVCDPNLNLDDWSQGLLFNQLVDDPKGQDCVDAIYANAGGQEGNMTITNNMPGLNASGLLWRGWFSTVPRGELVEDNPKCDRYSPNPNPLSGSWSQLSRMNLIVSRDNRTDPVFQHGSPMLRVLFVSLYARLSFMTGIITLGFNVISD